MAFTWQAHRSFIHPVTGLPDVAQEANFVMLSNGGERIYIQRGQVYAGSLDRPARKEELPGWFWQQYRSLTPEARKAVDYPLPEDEVQTLDQLPAEFLQTLRSLPESIRRQLLPVVEDTERAPRMAQDETSDPDEGEDTEDLLDALKKDSEALGLRLWTCDTCNEVMRLNQKGVHIARHRKAQKAEERKLNG